MRSKTKCINQPVVLQFIQFLTLGLFILNITACSSGAGEASAADGSAVKGNSDATVDLAIAQAVYFDERIPAGFYTEANPDDAYYVTSHVKNTDILPLVDRAGQPVYELASDDFSESMAWSEQSAGYQATYKQLVDNSETSLYHQFTRVDPNSPQVIYLNRVLKASVLDRNGVDDNYKGRITLGTVTASDIKLIVEYLWTFTMDNNYGNAVLSSLSSETDDEFVQVLQQAKLTAGIDGACDSIEVYESRYSVSKASGFIWKDKVVQRVISTKRTGESLEICQA